MAQIGIIGAGPAGLAAALFASQKGHDCTVFESASNPGGMAASFVVAGQRVDLGSHRLHPATEPHLLALIKQIMGDDLQIRERNGRINLRDRWVKFPLRAADLIRKLPTNVAFRIAGETLTKRFRNSIETNFYESVQHRLGPTVAEEFYGPFAEKLYGVKPHQLSVEIAQRRIAATSGFDVIRKIAKATRTSGRVFLYPRYGYGSISERLADAANEAGTQLCFNSPITKLQAEKDSVAITSAGRIFEFEQVWSTIPSPNLLAITKPSPPSATIEAARSLRNRAMVLVYLVIPKPQYTPFDAHYIPTTETIISRLSEPKNYRDGPDPSNQTVLCAEVPCWNGDTIWNSSPGELGELVSEDLRRMGLPDPQHVHVELKFLPSVYPVFEHLTSEARTTTQLAAQAINRVVSFGRHGLGVPDNLHHVMRMSEHLVNSLSSDGALDTSKWDEALGSFTKHVVED
ncbi:MAG: FAD-dependent oxidoreductase [Actinomycetota bacterium]|nr:FAD-dependent oxidoreductase [Actinomycetota bacterium]